MSEIVSVQIGQSLPPERWELAGGWHRCLPSCRRHSLKIRTRLTLSARIYSLR